MVPLGHCNWFWRKLLYNYWIESFSNGNSISKGKSATISKKILEQLCFSFKTIISYNTKQAILNFTKGCRTSSYKLLLLQQYSAISWYFLQKEMPEFLGQVTTGEQHVPWTKLFLLERGTAMSLTMAHLDNNLEYLSHSANYIWIGYFQKGRTHHWRKAGVYNIF